MPGTPKYGQVNIRRETRHVMDNFNRTKSRGQHLTWEEAAELAWDSLARKGNPRAVLRRMRAAYAEMMTRNRTPTADTGEKV